MNYLRLLFLCPLGLHKEESTPKEEHVVRMSEKVTSSSTNYSVDCGACGEHLDDYGATTISGIEIDMRGERING